MTEVPDNSAPVDIVQRLRATRENMPHQYPKGMGEAVAWYCAACGKLVIDSHPETQCTVDWRPPSIFDQAADEIERLRAAVGLHQPDTGCVIAWCVACNFAWPCPTYRTALPSTEGPDQ